MTLDHVLDPSGRYCAKCGQPMIAPLGTCSAARAEDTYKNGFTEGFSYAVGILGFLEARERDPSTPAEVRRYLRAYLESVYEGAPQNTRAYAVATLRLGTAP
jgi:hypothetical protein